MAILKDIMNTNIELVNPGDSLRAVANKMREHDTGFLPVGENDRLVGVITDRDIVLRGLAEGINPDSALNKELLSSPVEYLYEDQDVSEAETMMKKKQIRRLLVLNRDKRLVGVISLGDFAKGTPSDRSGDVLKSVSE